MLRVSQSKVKTFRRCHRQYHNKFVRGLRRKKMKRPLIFGRIVHRMIQRYAEGDDPEMVLTEVEAKLGKLFAEEREEYGNIIYTIRTTMEEYFDYWEGSEREFHYVRRAGRSSEHPFEIELIPGIVLWKGTIDAVTRAKKLRWLTEHKTFTKLPNEDERWRNLQSVTYIKAMQILGWPEVDGVAWDYVRSKQPSSPEVLKSDKMSGKKIDTLPAFLENDMRRIKAEGFEVEQKVAKKLMAEAKENRPNWFLRFFNPVQEDTADNIFKQFESTVREMVDKHGKVSDMCIDRHCSWCDYEALCRAELTGGDVDYVEKKEYRKEEDPDDYGDEAEGG